jgi:hypothetical protein
MPDAKGLIRTSSLQVCRIFLCFVLLPRCLKETELEGIYIKTFYELLCVRMRKQMSILSVADVGV